MKLIIVDFLLLLVLCACNNYDRVTAEIKALMGREITFPKGYKSLSCHDSLKVEPLLGADVKMVSYIDNLPCTSCGIKMLYNWIAEIDSMEQGLPYVIVVQTDKKEELFDIISHVSFPRPLMIYDSDVLKTENHLDVLARNKTFLLNRDNKIVLVGEPFGCSRMFDLYKQQIEALKAEYSKK